MKCFYTKSKNYSTFAWISQNLSNDTQIVIHSHSFLCFLPTVSNLFRYFCNYKCKQFLLFPRMKRFDSNLQFSLFNFTLEKNSKPVAYIKYTKRQKKNNCETYLFRKPFSKRQALSLLDIFYVQSLWASQHFYDLFSRELGELPNNFTTFEHLL